MKNTDLETVCLHWDGKLLPGLEGKQKVDRLPIIISNGEIEQLLEVPPLDTSTGRAQALAICKAVYEWGLQDKVKALVFDTTAVNTGRLNGTATILENLLEKELLYLPCRHHIYELVLKSVFDLKISKSENPNVVIFQKFQKAWPKINVKNISSGISDKRVEKKFCAREIEIIISNLEKFLNAEQPRADYREFLELIIIFLGKTPSRGLKIKAPGAMHHARWMSKAIYSLKIFLFRNEFELTKKEEKALCEISIFLIKIYADAWFTSPLPIKAPFCDFNFLIKLHEYAKYDSEISKIASEKFCRHLWYLGSEAVAFAFFDSSVSSETKAKMVERLNRESSSKQNDKKANVTISEILEEGIEQFVSKTTLNFFTRFNININFLKKPPSEWEVDENYKEAIEKIKTIKVVNDAAERGVKLIQDYNSILSTNEEQKQYILQVVQDYRRRFPDCNKYTLLNTNY